MEFPLKYRCKVLRMVEISFKQANRQLESMPSSRLRLINKQWIKSEIQTIDKSKTKTKYLFICVCVFLYLSHFGDVLYKRSIYSRSQMNLLSLNNLFCIFRSFVVVWPKNILSLFYWKRYMVKIEYEKQIQIIQK